MRMKIRVRMRIMMRMGMRMKMEDGMKMKIMRMRTGMRMRMWTGTVTGMDTGPGTHLAALLLPEDSGWRVALALALEGHTLPGVDSLVAGAGDKLGWHCHGTGRERLIQLLCQHPWVLPRGSPLPCTVRVPDASALPTLLSAMQV